jgi:hypothetical protein
MAADRNGKWERRATGTRILLIADQRWRASSNRERMEPMQKTKRADAISVDNSLSYSVQIDATFGSKFQRSVAIKNLNELLAAWKGLVEAKHTKNAVRVTRSRD